MENNYPLPENINTDATTQRSAVSPRLLIAIIVLLVVGVAGAWLLISQRGQNEIVFIPGANSMTGVITSVTFEKSEFILQPKNFGAQSDWPVSPNPYTVVWDDQTTFQTINTIEADTADSLDSSILELNKNVIVVARAVKGDRITAHEIQIIPEIPVLESAGE